MARIELSIDERKLNWDDVEFRTVYNRLYENKIIGNQTELANLLKLGRAAISYVAKKGTVPREWKTRFERAGINWEWVAYGDGIKYNSNKLFTSGLLVSLPRIIDVNDNVVEKSKDDYEYSIHKKFLSQLNIDPSNLGYFVQTGSAMSPYASENDIWIVDMINNIFDIGSTYVIKIGESSKIGVRTIVNINGVDNSVCLGHGNSSITSMIVKNNDIQICGRCVAKFCKVL